MAKRARQDSTALEYQSGFGNHFESEALAGALPRGQNNPKRCPYGLYAEQLSGTSFTTPILKNRKVWLYRIMPSVAHGPYKPMDLPRYVSDFSNCIVTPERYRWKPLPLPKSGSSVTFLDGIVTIGGAGSTDTKTGFGIHLYVCNASMDRTALCNSDGDYLIVPQQGTLSITTECGKMTVASGEIVVIPRGHRFAVSVDEACRGYICELFEGHFAVPDRGPIGSNGLANERDFKVPQAAYSDDQVPFTVIQKFGGSFFAYEQQFSAFNVVAWHGNYLPYKYDLNLYCAMNSVTYDHPDPSIFTVLTAPTAETGVAAIDFVVFPKRWQVQWSSFRLPYYHRNCMTEYMGNIQGSYEAKPNAFLPGGGSLHSCMASHGPDAEAFARCSSASDDPFLLPDGMAFMFESTYIMRLTPFAANSDLVDDQYVRCWDDIQPQFDPLRQ